MEDVARQEMGDNYEESLSSQGVPEAIRYVIWEQLDKDVYWVAYKETDSYALKTTEVGACGSGYWKDKYNDEWRAAELERHPEYGPDGENALQVQLAEITADEELPESQQSIILTSETEPDDLVDISGYLGGKRDRVLVGRIDSFSQQYQMATDLYPCCERCFFLGYSYEEGYMKLDPPINAEDKHWFSPWYEACPRCHRKGGCFKIMPITTNAWDLKLIQPLHAGSITIRGVTVFDLGKGNVIAVEGKDEYSNEDKSYVRLCKKLQVLDSETIQRLVRSHISLGDSTGVKILTQHANVLPQKLQALPEIIDAEIKIRKLFFEKCKQSTAEVLLTTGLTEIYNEGDDDIKSSSILKVDNNGRLIFDLSKNRDLRNFRDSLTEYRSGDDGILKRVGTTPTRFRWYPKPNPSQNVLPEK